MTLPPFFDLELEEIFDENNLSDVERKVIEARAVTNFSLRLTEIIEKYNAEIEQAFPNQEVNIEDKGFWKELTDKVPQIKEDLDKYIENDLPDLIAEAINKVKKP